MSTISSLNPDSSTRDLYPPIEPYRNGKLPVSPRHTLYFEEAGNPQGLPALFVHGGPGGGIISQYRQYFHPQKYRIILFDQRGCGQSTPYADLEENTTWDLVADMEKLRQHLGIKKWLVFGGSWGSTLALAYAQTHPDSCLGLVLRGIFLVRDEELRWFYQDGASYIFPDLWEDYQKVIPQHERGDMIRAYYQRLCHTDPSVRQAAAIAWSVWEGSTSALLPKQDKIDHYADPHFAEAFARIECHYFINKGFMSANQLLQNVEQIRHLPGVIIHGRYDMVCPLKSAWDLHRAWPEARLEIIPNAGHTIAEEGIRSALIKATDEFAQRGSFN